MKVLIGRDEWWPVFWLCAGDGIEGYNVVDVPEELLSRYIAIHNEFVAMQDILADLWEKEDEARNTTAKGD